MWSAALVIFAAACNLSGPVRPSPSASRGTAATPGFSSSPPAGEVTAAYPDEPASLNPYLFEGDAKATRDLLRPVLPTLLSVSPNLSFAPMAAARVPTGSDISNDPFSVQFHLNPHAVWSDSEPITSSDVQFTWQVINDPRWPIAARARYRHLKQVKVLSPRTFRLVFDQPFVHWRELFSAGDYILPRHLLEGKDFSAEMAGSIAFSAGPFLLKAYNRGLGLDYVANPKWWGPGPRIESLKVLFVSDTEIAIRLLSAGRVSVLSSGSRLNLNSRLGAIPGASVMSRFGSSWWEVIFNQSRPSTSQMSVRRAVALSFDRAGVLDTFVRSEGRRLGQLWPGGAAPTAFERFGFDPAGAADLVKRTKSTSVVLSYPATNPIAGMWAVVLQRGLSNAGIRAELRGAQAPQFYGEYRAAGDFDLAIQERSSAGRPLPAGDYLSGYAPPAGTNYSRMRSAEADAALEAASSDRSKEAAAINVLAGQLPALALFEEKAYLASRPGVSGLSPNAGVDGPFWNAEAWSVR